MAIIEQVKTEIEGENQERERKKILNSQMNQAIPRARAQYFRNLLLHREQSESEDQFLFYNVNTESFYVLALRNNTPFNHAQQLMIQQAFCEVYGNDSVFAATAIHNDVFLLLDSKIASKEVWRLLQFFKKEWKSTGVTYEQVALSQVYKIGILSDAYEEIQSLFQMGTGVAEDVLLQYQLFREMDTSTYPINLKRLGDMDEIGELLYIVCTSIVKMNLKEFSQQEKLKSCCWALKVLYGIDAEYTLTENSDWDIVTWFTQKLVEQKPSLFQELTKNGRMKQIYLSIYENFQNPDLNQRFLSREILYMNEDYLGRLFTKQTGMKFTDYLKQQRIRMAVELLEYDPYIRISQLATMVGYAADGQYFSKAFRKVTGVSPSAYQEKLYKGQSDH